MHKLESNVRNTTVWYLACQAGSCHFGAIEPDQELSTGQKNLTTFETEAELKAAVDKMNGSGYYDSIVNPEVII